MKASSLRRSRGGLPQAPERLRQARVPLGEFTHMHFGTHTKPDSIGQSGRWQSPYHDAMIDHDKNVGTVLKALDDLGMADGTIVMYSTDNGPHMNSWPDAAMTPFRNEKNSNWEGAFRVPAMVRWPGHIKPGTISTDIVSHLDWAPALLAAAGVPDVKEQFLETFQEFPSNQKARSFGIDQVMEQLKSGAAASP
jgi:arylsulfatase A-like enzyme